MHIFKKAKNDEYLKKTIPLLPDNFVVSFLLECGKLKEAAEGSFLIYHFFLNILSTEKKISYESIQAVN